VDCFRRFRRTSSASGEIPGAWSVNKKLRIWADNFRFAP
jgi:hypothetical protein